MSARSYYEQRMHPATATTLGTWRPWHMYGLNRSQNFNAENEVLCSLSVEKLAAKDAFSSRESDSQKRTRSDPRTLIRAARAKAVEQSAFALAARIPTLRAIANGWGDDIIGNDVMDAYAARMAAPAAAGAGQSY